MGKIFGKYLFCRVSWKGEMAEGGSKMEELGKKKKKKRGILRSYKEKSKYQNLILSYRYIGADGNFLVQAE